MATISIASAKGGCGKTTLAILLGTELALEGYTVALLDCDVNQHATAFGKKAAIPGFAVVPSIDEGNVLSELRKADADAEVVSLICQAAVRPLPSKRCSAQTSVLVPCQVSLPGCARRLQDTGAD